MPGVLHVLVPRLLDAVRYRSAQIRARLLEEIHPVRDRFLLF